MIELREMADGRFSRGYGGDTLNTAVYLARLGVAVDYVTALSSSLIVSQRIAASFGIEFPDGVVDGLIEVVRSGEGLVSEVIPLQVAPETLDIVQLRSVFRQPLDPEPMSPLREGRPSRLTGVDGAVVEHKHDGLEHAAELGTIAAVDLLQESDEV